MSQILTEISPGVPAPWGGRSDRFAQAIQKRFSCQALGVAVFDVRRPRPDAVLGAHGISAEALIGWCESAYQRDPLFRAARRRGVAAAGPDAPADQRCPLHHGHVMVLMLPESLVLRRWWWFLLARGTAFSAHERQQAEQWLRQWRVGFCQLDEPGAGRLMIGHDDQLLHADPCSEQWLGESPNKLDELLGLFRPVVAQRWPNITDQAMRDVALDLSGTPYWVRFCRGRGIDRDVAEHWFVELRPLEEDDLPTVHEVEDPRIARAIAFIHDHFQRSPSLTRLADAVHISPFHFHRMFTRQVGLSPKQYLQRKQMQVAKWVLRSTRTPIGRIAAQAGFASHGHFTSTFHRLVGVSPSEYREKR
ncbi:MAG: AraC family transcriptional regulator [Phycisphaeraceae bacterium]